MQNKPDKLASHVKFHIKVMQNIGLNLFLSLDVDIKILVQFAWNIIERQISTRHLQISDIKKNTITVKI